MAARAQHFHPQHFNAQARPQQSTFLPQQYIHYQGPTFANQTDPWNSEQPMRSPDAPHSGIVLFDPATDPSDYSAFINPHVVDPVTDPSEYSAFINPHVDSWTMNNTDPNYLVSPNEPVMPPQDLFSIATQNLVQRQPGRPVAQGPVHAHAYAPNSSLIEMRIHRASPSPNSQRFAPYDAPVLRMGSRRSSQQHPSPITTSIELPSGMNLPSAGSPYASASSPGGSEGMFSSYQQSDPDVERRQSHSHQSFGHTMRPSSSVEVEFSPSRTLLEAANDLSPDPEGTTGRRQVGPIRSTGRPGGRALGTHLEPKVAKEAHDMRKIVACWHCVLQRDKVSAMHLIIFRVRLILGSADPVTLANVV
jgi:hypothetical protein